MKDDVSALPAREAARSWSALHRHATHDVDSSLWRELRKASRAEGPDACHGLNSSPSGLTHKQAAARLRAHGPNQIAQEQRPTVLQELIGRTRNPLNALLLTLAAVSFFLGDTRAAVVIALMVVLAISTAFIQEHRSNDAAAKLRAMVKTMVRVKRRDREAAGTDEEALFTQIPVEQVVSGDIVRLAAGDIIPGDLRVLEAKDFFVNQAVLTGESMPAEKFAAPCGKAVEDPFDLPNVCFLGSNVVSGYATGLVVHTGRRTYFGHLAALIARERVPTSFDRGVDRFTWLMIRFIAVMVPMVFVINGLTKHDWLEALLFALAVGVGLTPEMLPMIVTVNLAKGAIAMSKKRVIVKRLQAIQNFGAMDVLCTDKTGTLTQDRIILKRHLDIRGEDSDRVLELAYLNAHYQSGLKNLLDLAVLKHVELHPQYGAGSSYRKIDEIPFDFTRRRLSVIVSQPDGRHLLICKGAVEEIFSICTRYEVGGETGPLDDTHFVDVTRETTALNEDGFRVVAIAYKEIGRAREHYSIQDESDLTLLGYIAFLDPPKDSAGAAIAALRSAGVGIKVLTGDNEVVTRKVCRDVGLDPGRVALGPEIDKLSEEALADLTRSTAVFAKVSPDQKARIIHAVQSTGHIVGFLGDGINDGAALKRADVGISVDTAVDIARESADIILLEKSLTILEQGAVEGRKIFGNITKYIKMGASSNFGNMFSVLGASIFLPFLPMAPIQVLTNNLLYDFSQTTIPTDHVDEEYLHAPRKWDIGNIFKFMVFIGPISSLFDYATFFVMLYVFNCWNNPSLFQTGWFVESLLTQTLIIHIIRTAKVPFLQSRASGALTATSILICAIGIVLPYSWVGAALGFTPLPPLYWLVVSGFIAAYATLTHLVKSWFVRRWGL